uniref:winged helix-turn-helix domain-containing protein n=1 Tax=Parerythrobacter lutipelagi TaxID=1964208 RepID=UPI001F009326|nr:winged helix-turn-helix domain-containing protein [Parerythrobacter lutipelagi]
MPRQIQAGPVLLDLFHRDAQIEEDWLRLHPREFEVLWYLAERPRQRHSRLELLRDVWRLRHDPETNRVAVTIARVRRKLARFKLDSLIATDLKRGAYFLDCDAHAVAAG